MPTRREVLQSTLGFGAVAFFGNTVTGVNVSHLFASTATTTYQTPLLGASIPKFVDPLPTFTNARVRDTTIKVIMEEFQQQILPASVYAHLQEPYRAGTYVWGYKVGERPHAFPGYTIEAQRGVPTTITFTNHLPIAAKGSLLERLLTIDQTIHWADPLNAMDMSDPMHMGPTQPYQGPIPTVVHLHGAEVQSTSDGAPEAWFTRNGIHGMAYSTVKPTDEDSAVYTYPNSQPATTLWFHDHALGMTRINVFAGLAAFYLLRDSFDTGRPDNQLHLPAGSQEIELAIQDRQFDTNGQLLFPNGTPPENPTGLNGGPPNPGVHPYWIPEFFGDVMVVNGKSWPYLDVEPRRYRFRMLDGCNARFLQMQLVDAETKAIGPLIWQIATDGGMLDAPVKLNDPNSADHRPLFIAPGERADVIIDFSKFAGKTLTLTNAAFYPYPSGNIPDPAVDGQIMQFRVSLPLTSQDTTYNPANGKALRGGTKQAPKIVRLANQVSASLAKGVTPTVLRQLVLVESEGPGGPLTVLVNNTRWDGLRDGTAIPLPDSQVGKMGLNMPSHGHMTMNHLTELPQVGATEEWDIINLTMDAHPIHLHLIQFQLINRQYFDKGAYRRAYDALFPGGKYAGIQPDGSWGVTKYKPGIYIPGFGPPQRYLAKNAAGAIGGNPDVTPYLKDTPLSPKLNEAGWKDTLKMFPNQITRIVMRWAPIEVSLKGVTAGQNRFPFDPTIGPGYVWHCHILDHEDNEMMRPIGLVK